MGYLLDMNELHASLAIWIFNLLIPMIPVIPCHGLLSLVFDLFCTLNLYSTFKSLESMFLLIAVPVIITVCTQEVQYIVHFCIFFSTYTLHYSSKHTFFVCLDSLLLRTGDSSVEKHRPCSS